MRLGPLLMSRVGRTGIHTAPFPCRLLCMLWWKLASILTSSRSMVPKEALGLPLRSFRTVSEPPWWTASHW